MTVAFERRSSASAAWSLRLASFAAVLFAVSGLAHRYALMETVPFFWVLGIVGALALAALGLSAAGFAALWERGDKGGRKALAGGLLALLVLSPFAVGAWRVVAYPRLNDISTDRSDPPALAAVAALRPPLANDLLPIAPDEADLMIEGYPEVNGRRYSVSPDRVLEAAEAIIAERGWRLVETRGVPQQDAEIVVEAQAFSYFLRLPADISLRLTDEGATTFVDMRSASVYGAHDLGDNAKRITRFLGDLDSAVSALPERQ